MEPVSFFLTNTDTSIVDSSVFSCPTDRSAPLFIIQVLEIEILYYSRAHFLSNHNDISEISQKTQVMRLSCNLQAPFRI
jgi:hypothetical protein